MSVGGKDVNFHSMPVNPWNPNNNNGEGRQILKPQNSRACYGKVKFQPAMIKPESMISTIIFISLRYPKEKK